MDFKVGERVICVESYENDYGDNLVKGETYTIQTIKSCHCGTVGIDVGLTRVLGQVVCDDCGYYFGEGKMFHKKRWFAKIESLDTDVDVNAFMDIFNEKTEKV